MTGRRTRPAGHAGPRRSTLPDVLAVQHTKGSDRRLRCLVSSLDLLRSHPANRAGLRAESLRALRPQSRFATLANWRVNGGHTDAYGGARMNQTQQVPFGNRARNCVACGKDPGLRYWHSEGNVLCWPCWERVEHLDHKAAEVIGACFAIRRGDAESLSGPERDDLEALGFLTAER